MSAYCHVWSPERGSREPHGTLASGPAAPKQGTHARARCHSDMRLLPVVAVLVAAPISALADDPDPGPRYDLPTSVHVRLDDQSAVLVARYAIDVSGPEIHADELNLTLPHHGVVTGVIATVDGAPHRLALAPSDHAPQRFQNLAEVAGGAHRTWAIKISQATPTDATVLVEIAAPHAARVRLDLELSAPTCFSDDIRYVSVPNEWRPTIDATLRAHRKVDAIDGACGTDSFDDHVWLAL